jgi:predicted metal-dependent hydrolase
MKQLNLYPNIDATHIKSHIEKFVSKNVAVVVTDNSSVMLSIKTRKDRLSLRLHKMFLSADHHVLDELACYLRNSRIKTPLIREFINSNTHKLKKKPPRKIRLVHKGKKFNLLNIFNKVNSEYFDGTISSSITWSARSPRRSVAKRTLGSYSQDIDLIRINPVLELAKVPGYFLEYVVYHEMLHADMKNAPSIGRRKVHSSEFKRREKLFLHYDRAMTWEKKRWG